jgi:signal transduction histidine kinase
MLRVSADEKGIGLVAHWDPQAEMTVRGDGRAFRQIVTNLLGNAVKFTDRGAVAMAATAAVEADRVRIAVEVADTGRGIPAEALPHVFERFYQAESSMARSTEGTGLGLAISQTLARMMGGAITVTSEPGAGSTFTFTASYPLAEEARDAA